jgi:hypothetical protein
MNDLSLLLIWCVCLSVIIWSPAKGTEKPHHRRYWR